MLKFGRVLSLVILAFLASRPALALDLFWSGEFRSEFNWLGDYVQDSNTNGTPDAARAAAGGYYVKPGGSGSAHWQNLFLRLRPRAVLNDAVSIKSEWWVGDPVYGIFGNAAPTSPEGRYFDFNSSRGAALTAQRYWAEVETDFGVLQVGRVPLHWGLGLRWNSADGFDSRYPTTGDSVRLIANYGAFTLSPSFIMYSTGNTIGGACKVDFTTGACNTAQGSGAINEYSLIFKYLNKEEQFEGGVNFIRRIGGGVPTGSTTAAGPDYPTIPSGTGSLTGGGNYNTWSIFAKKTVGRFALSAEAPVVSGNVGPAAYNTWAIATEVEVKATEIFTARVRAGKAPGQPSRGNNTPDAYRAYYFHPDYRLGRIMFNYQLMNIAGPQTTNGGAAATSLSSPYDAPIVNANYLALGGDFQVGRWTLGGGFAMASANETAKASEAFFFNHSQRRYVAYTTGSGDQSSSLGWEMDYGATLKLDDYVRIGLDLGFYFPGAFYQFSNTATANPTDMVFGMVGKLGISF